MHAHMHTHARAPPLPTPTPPPSPPVVAVYAAAALRLPCDARVVSAMQSTSLARGMAALSPGHMARAAWACARLGARPSHRWLSSLLRAAHVLLGQFNARELAALAWGLASLGVELPPAFVTQLEQVRRGRVEQKCH
jgi:hypothetical protein